MRGRDTEKKKRTKEEKMFGTRDGEVADEKWMSFSLVW